MLLPGKSLVKVYQDKVRCGEGVAGYLRELAQMLGYHQTPTGPAIGKNASFSPREFSLVEVAEAFVGSNEHSSHRNAFERGSGFHYGLATESVGGVVTGAQLSPVNAMLGTTLGLLNAEMLAGYNSGDTIGREIVTWKSPVNAEEVKIWQYTEPTEVFDDLQEGQERPTGNYNAEWVRARKMKEQGQTLNISWRAVHFATDSSQALDQARNLGNVAAWVIEDRILSAVFGLEGTYKYGVSTGGDTETEYQTYIASGGPYANYQTNELVNEGSLDTANVMLRAMRNPATGKPINLGATKYLIVSSFYERLATQLARFQQTIIGKDSDQERLVVGQTTASGIVVKVSPRMEDLHVAKGFQGNSLTLAQARKRWVYGDTKLAFWYRQARDFTIANYTADTDPSLRRHGLIASSTYDEMGQCGVIQPRASVLNRKDS